MSESDGGEVAELALPVAGLSHPPDSPSLSPRQLLPQPSSASSPSDIHSGTDQYWFPDLVENDATANAGPIPSHDPSAVGIVDAVAGADAENPKRPSDASAASLDRTLYISEYHHSLKRETKLHLEDIDEEVVQGSKFESLFVHSDSELMGLLSATLLTHQQHPKDSGAVESLVRQLFELFRAIKSNVLKQILDRRRCEPEKYEHNPELEWVIPPLLGVLHNNEEESSREDDDDPVSKRIGADLNGVAIVAKILQTCTDERVKSNASACLMALTRTMFKDGNKLLLAQEDAVSPLCDLLAAAKTDYALFWCTACLRNVSRRFDNKFLIADRSNAIATLVKLMDGRNDVEVKAGACSAICNLSWGQLRLRVYQAGAIPILIDALRSENKHVQRSAAGALRNLACHDDIRLEIAKRGAIPRFVQLLSSDDDDVQYWVAAALKNLACDDSIVSIIWSNGAIPLLLSILRTTKSVKVIDRVTGVIWHISDNRECRKEICEHNGIPLLLSILEKNIDTFIVDHCLCTLFELSQMEGSRAKIVAHGGVRLLANLLASDHEPTKYYASNTLGHLVADLDVSEDVELLIGKVVPLLQTYLDSGDVVKQRVAAVTIRNVCINDKLGEAVATGGAIPILIHLLSSEHAELANTAVSALCNLACNDHSQVVMKTQGIFAPLLKLLVAPDPSPNVIRVLWNLSCSTQNRQALAQHRFVPALIKSLVTASGLGEYKENHVLPTPPPPASPTEHGLIKNIQFATGVLLHITWIESSRPEIMREGGLLPLLLLLRWPDGPTRSYAHETITAICQHEWRHILYGAIPLILHIRTEQQNCLRLAESAKSTALTTHERLGAGDKAEFHREILQLVEEVMKELEQAISAELPPDLHPPDDPLEPLVQGDEEDSASETASNAELATSSSSIASSSSSKRDFEDDRPSFSFLVNNPLYSDLTLQVGEETFFAHRAILHGNSRYFRAMFETGMTESKKEVLKIQLPPGIGTSAFLEVLKYIYTSSCTITSDNVCNILELADLYCLHKLKEECERHLVGGLTPDNVFSLLAVAHHYASLQWLGAACVTYILKRPVLYDDLTDTDRQLLQFQPPLAQ